MLDNAVKYFIRSAVVILGVAAGAKLISAIGADRAQELQYPAFGLTLRRLFVIGGLVEIGVVVILCSNLKAILRVAAIAGLASLLLSFRLYALAPDTDWPCRCLGSMSEWLRISPRTEGWISGLALAYLLAGSYFLLIFGGRQIWREALVRPIARAESP